MSFGGSRESCAQYGLKIYRIFGDHGDMLQNSLDFETRLSNDENKMLYNKMGLVARKPVIVACDQQSHRPTCATAHVNRCLEILISLFTTGKISIFKLVSVAE